jgi:hypothetical protein
MLELINSKRMSISILAGFLLFIAPAFDQEPLAAERKSAFTILHEVLQAFYPEIFGKDWYVAFSTGQGVDHDPWGETGGFQFKVSRFGPGVSWNPTSDSKTGRMIPPPENSTFLEGSFWADKSGRVIRLIVEGDLAHSKQNKVIRELAQSHPEWSEDEAVRALKEAGARYGPSEKEQFLQAIHLEKLTSVLGDLKIRLVEFQGLSPDHVGSFASLFWVVQAEGRFPDGSHCAYGFSFEPFDGKLMGVSLITDKTFPSEK